MFSASLKKRNKDRKKVLGLGSDSPGSADWWQCVLLVKEGVGDWEKVWKIDPLERACLAYSFAHINGCKINWDTGEISKPE